jgi:hypothetical protein
MGAPCYRCTCYRGAASDGEQCAVDGTHRLCVRQLDSRWIQEGDVIVVVVGGFFGGGG